MHMMYLKEKTGKTIYKVLTVILAILLIPVIWAVLGIVFKLVPIPIDVSEPNQETIEELYQYIDR